MSSAIVGYSPYDWFYTPTDTCNDLLTQNEKNECEKNKTKNASFKTNSSRLATNEIKYNDLLTVYNYELFTVLNLVIGIGLLCYYIYLNQAVFAYYSGKMGAGLATALASVKKQVGLHLSIAPTIQSPTQSTANSSAAPK